MNDVSPDERSPFASYSIAKADDENERSEKALLITRESDQTRDATKDSFGSFASSDHGGKLKDSMEPHLPPMAASKAMMDIMKEAADGHDADFDVSMVPMSFPQRLHQLLSDEANSDAIAWLPHGKGFVIRNKKVFSEVTLPKYFKESKFTSFTRKLNRWGFCRITRGTESGAYYHPYFQKGNLRRTLLMTCSQRPSGKKKMPTAAAPSAAANPAPVNLEVVAALMEQFGDTDPLAAVRRQLDLTNSALLFRQRNEQQILEQARAEHLLRQEQEQLAELEELRRGQQQNLSAAAAAAGQVETALSQYQNLLAQFGASSTISNLLSSNPASGLSQQQNLLARLGAASSPLRRPMLAGGASLESALAELSAGAGSLASASTFGTPRHDTFARSAFESSLAGNQQHAAVLEAVSEIQRSDPAAYMAILFAAKQKSLAQANAAGQPSTQDSLTLQQKLTEFLQQRDAAGATSNANESQCSPQKLPPKKR